MNTLQKTTKSGKPVINTITRLPEYNYSVFNRINTIKKQLGFINGKPTAEQRWETIYNEMTILTS